MTKYIPGGGGLKIHIKRTRDAWAEALALDQFDALWNEGYFDEGSSHGRCF
jgi:hypothetical protein